MHVFVYLLVGVFVCVCLCVRLFIKDAVQHSSVKNLSQKDLLVSKHYRSFSCVRNGKTIIRPRLNNQLHKAMPNQSGYQFSGRQYFFVCSLCIELSCAAPRIHLAC